MREKLRIAIDGRPALWPRTGIGTIVSNVLDRISNFDSTNQYFAYFNSDPAISSRSWDQFEKRSGGPRQKLLWANTWLPGQLKQDDIDVFITFLDKEIPLVPTRSQIVCMVHDLIPLKFPETVFRNLAHQLYYSALIRAAIRRADIILTNSDYSRREILSALGARESKIRKITLGVDRATFYDRASTDKVLKRNGLRAPFVLALGSTEPRKNNVRVLEAVRRLRADYPDLSLAIAGNNWRGKVFDSRLLDHSVRLLGHVSDADLPVLMQSAEMLVFPSLHEGFGLPVIEAMALGVPVVTSNAAALPEVAEDAALLVNPRDVDQISLAMRRILEDHNLADDLRRRGRARASNFRWETTCKELVSLCEGLTYGHAPRTEPVTP
jgi:glycosyltransferase involved in cell wall biosynthesis